jgi:hypothetical protein
MIFGTLCPLHAPPRWNSVVSTAVAWAATAATSSQTELRLLNVARSGAGRRPETRLLTLPAARQSPKPDPPTPRAVFSGHRYGMACANIFLKTGVASTRLPDNNRHVTVQWRSGSPRRAENEFTRTMNYSRTHHSQVKYNFLKRFKYAFGKQDEMI